MVELAYKKQAIQLRKRGYSYNLIRESVPVSKSTLTLWLKDVPYRPNRIVRNRIQQAIDQLGAAQNRQKSKSVSHARAEAQHELRTFSKRDLWMLGLGLYIGEGSKTTGTVAFTNSDPATVILIIHWLRDVIGLGNENLSLLLHIYPDNNEKEAKQYWSELTKVPLTRFNKTTVDTRTNKVRSNHNILRYGTIQIRVRANGEPKFGVFLFRKIMFWAEEALKKTRK